MITLYSHGRHLTVTCLWLINSVAVVISNLEERVQMKYLVLTMALLLASLAAADWSDNFDSYTAGSGLSGQGGWFPWDNNPAGDAYITTTQAKSAPNSVDITPTSDMVQEFNIMSGTPTITAWNYIPSGSTGIQYFILLTVYMGSDSDWALDLKFDSDAGVVSTVEGTATTGIVYDQWVEVKVEIDLAADTQSIYYNGALLETIPWSPTSQIYQFGALDLFGNSASSIYWDDLTVVAPGSALAPATWASIKAAL